VRTVLDSVSLIDLARGDLLAAGTHAPLRSNYAIHLTVALRVGANEIVTYDEELIERATAAGVPVLSPGNQLAPGLHSRTTKSLSVKPGT
jgi:predicted nucleic acid-binding protein